MKNKTKVDWKKIGRNEYVRLLDKTGEPIFVKSKNIPEYLKKGCILTQRTAFEPEQFNLLDFQGKFIDNWDKYHIPKIQRKRYFTPNDKKGYIRDLFAGDEISDFYFTDILRLKKSYKKSKTTIQDRDWDYFSEVWEAGYTFQSVDGNNRMKALYDFFNDEFRLPKGCGIPFLDMNGHLYTTPIDKEMNHSELVAYYGVSYLGALKQIKMSVKWVLFTTKIGIKNLFRSVNRQRQLKAQEDRNCIDADITELVWDIAVEGKNPNDNETWFKKVISRNNLRVADEHSFIAFSLFMIENLHTYTNPIFNKKPNSTHSEKLITEMYEEDDVSDKTIKEFKLILKQVKKYGELSGGETGFLNHKTFRLAFVCFIKRLRDEYGSHKWKNILKHMVDFDNQHTVSTMTYKCYGDEQDPRTYKKIRGSGAKHMNILFSFFVTQEDIMVANGFMYPKYKRKKLGNLRQELYTLQKGICKETNKPIDDYNNTGKYEVDHIIPISKWDDDKNDVNGIDNLQLIDRKANREKYNKIDNTGKYKKLSEEFDKLLDTLAKEKK